MQIVYNVTTQFVVEVGEDVSVEDILEMSEDEIVERMTDVTYEADDWLGTIDNQHGKVEFELLDDKDKSIRYFEKYLDD
jgi:tetrahydromethanopterin S-methyltransferase subunit B